LIGKSLKSTKFANSIQKQNKMKQTHIGHLAIFAVNLIFGINTPITKSILNSSLQIDALALTYLRFIGASIIFWLVSFIFKIPKASKKDIPFFLLASLFGVVLNQTSFVYGLSMTSPVDASIVVSLTPIVTMIFSAIFIKEPITLKKVVGVLIGCSGALILIMSSNSSSSNSSWVGNLICFVSCLSYGLYLTAFKPLIQRNHPITLMKWMFLFGTILSTPFTFSHLYSIEYSQITWEVTLKITYVILGATFLTYLLIPIGQTRIRPTTLSMYNYLQPIVTTILSVVMGLGIFGLKQSLATVLVFLGVYIVTQSKSRAQVLQEKSLKES
jgi:drug/metabolite transporter (DMT)-like permease